MTRRGGALDVNAVYGDGKGRWDGVAWIEDEMRKRAASPQKVTLADVFWSVSTATLTGDTAGYGQVVPLVHPRHDALRVLWHAPVGPVAAPLMPVFMGQAEVPPEYGLHRYLTTGESARFLDTRHAGRRPDTVSHVSQGDEVTRSAFYAFKRLMHLAFQAQDTILPETWDHWRGVEKDLRGEIADVLRSAEILLDAGAPRLAARLLGEHARARMIRALDEAEALIAASEARLRVAGRLNGGGTPMKPAQTW